MAILMHCETVYTAKFGISEAQWLKLQATNLQVLSSKTAGTFIVMKSGKILKDDFFPNFFFYLLKCVEDP